MKLGDELRANCTKAISDPDPAKRRPTLLARLEHYAKRVNDLADSLTAADKQIIGFEETLSQMEYDSDELARLREVIGDVRRGIRSIEELYEIEDAN